VTVRFADLSIAQKLTWVNTLSCGIALLLAASAFLAYDLLTFRQTLVSNVAARAEIVADNAASAVVFRDREAAAKTLAALRGDPHVLAAGIAVEGESTPFTAFGREDLPAFARGRPEGHDFTAERLILVRSIRVDEERVGRVFVESDLLQLRERIQSYLVIAALVLASSLLVAQLAAGWLQRTVTRPILELVDVTRRVSGEKDYGLRARSESRDEIGLLVRGLNEMLEQIQRRDEDLQGARDELDVRAAKLEIANRELEAFSYSVSHDLRAPLRGIDGFSHAVLEDYADRLDEKGKRHLERVRAAVRHMGALIDGMLGLSRLTRRDLRRERVDLSAIAKGMTRDLEQLEPDRPAEFVVAEGLVVDGDPELLTAVLQNLLDNAWKFTAKAERARIELGVGVREGERAFYVRDNGVGFDMSYVEKLFSPFQRLHAVTDFPGTGVGLATVKRIVARHGGEVWAEGAIGEGATFWFTLPQDAAPAEAARRAPRRRPAVPTSDPGA
jgi:signal transduction histidine kinase